MDVKLAICQPFECQRISWYETVPRELSLAEDDGRMIVKGFPVKEILDKAGKPCLVSGALTADDPVIELSGLTFRVDFSKEQLRITRNGHTGNANLERREEHSFLAINADDAVCMTCIN